MFSRFLLTQGSHDAEVLQRSGVRTPAGGTSRGKRVWCRLPAPLSLETTVAVIDAIQVHRRLAEFLQRNISRAVVILLIGSMACNTGDARYFPYHFDELAEHIVLRGFVPLIVPRVSNHTLFETPKLPCLTSGGAGQRDDDHNGREDLDVEPHTE